MSLMDNLVYLSGKYRVQRMCTCKKYSPFSFLWKQILFREMIRWWFIPLSKDSYSKGKTNLSFLVFHLHTPYCSWLLTRFGLAASYQDSCVCILIGLGKCKGKRMRSCKIKKGLCIFESMHVTLSDYIMLML